MEKTRRDTLAALLVGGGICGSLYWVSGHSILAVVTGVCWVCGLKITLHSGYRYPELTAGDTWSSNRWTGVAVGLTLLAALIGVSPALPISDELRFGLGLLVIGAGLVAYSAGTLAVVERTDGESETTTPSDPHTTPATDGE